MSDVLDFAVAVQSRASDPERSVWVNASAGTGKTKVLIERVLRLLLPRADGSDGARADKILCLTYTKAAAAEMTERLIGRLSKWVVMETEELRTQLADVLHFEPQECHFSAARRLFSTMVDGPEKVRIQTIHSFCQSVLARFPLEAGLSPNFTLIEGAELDQLLIDAQRNVFARATHDAALRDAIHRIGRSYNESGLQKILGFYLQDKRQLQTALKNVASDQWGAVFRSVAGVEADLNEETLAGRLADELTAYRPRLLRLAAALGQGIKDDQALADVIVRALEKDESSQAFARLAPAFYQKSGKPRSNGAGKGVRKSDPEVLALYEECAGWVYRHHDLRRALRLVTLNIDVLTFVAAVFDAFDAIKRLHNVVDFDDVIRRAAALLGGKSTAMSDMASWVMFKLDGGIDHVLVDEAQDTSPEQWQIIRAVVNEFYHGVGASDGVSRSLFVVGDKKQSIYSFQGADADSFEQSLDHLAKQAISAAGHIENVPMNVSFRTTTPVLTLVDQVFADAERQRNVRSPEGVTHLVKRAGQGGRVEVWPVIRASRPRIEATPWMPRGKSQGFVSAPAQLADKIARTIREWMDRGEVLPSFDRAIEPRDVLILVRKRAPFLALLLDALQRHRVPVSGLDRLQILESLAVRDLLAAATFALLPEDDFNLSCLVTSPLMGGTDDDLIALCAGRKGSVWAAMRADARYAHWVSYLRGVIDLAGSRDVYGFFSAVLQGPCPADAGGSAMRAMTARLGPDIRDAIDEMMQEALRYGDASGGLQGFINALQMTNPEVKRESGRHENVVRLMTVHGSKGLEAPIVILPDTINLKPSQSKGGVYWPEDTDVPLPIYIPVNADMPGALDPVFERVAEAGREESDRLLYVALTRARDVLVVAGAAGEKTDITGSWYAAVESGMRQFEGRAGYEVKEDGALVFAAPQTAAEKDSAVAERRAREQAVDDGVVIPPASDDVFVAVADEGGLQRPLRPDRASGEKVIQSPLLARREAHKFQRGLIIHKLLQLLPSLPILQRRAAAQAYLARYAGDLDAAQVARIEEDVFNVLADATLADLFAADSLAEVPVSGVAADGRLVAGQIDRLHVGPECVRIIDYKTDLLVPGDMTAVPVAYLRQMRAYRDLVARIYPGRRIVCLLLWTSVARVMPLADQVLDGA